MELTPELISLLIDRLFAPEERETAAGVLADYGIMPHEREPLRVQVAILKLSEGNPERLRELVADAQHDHRDVLAWAEYPTEITSATWSLPEEEQARIRAADREQYEAWLTAHTRAIR